MECSPSVSGKRAKNDERGSTHNLHRQSISLNRGEDVEISESKGKYSYEAMER
jgi:hypothetical protein